ncbi:gamma-glutamyltransferase [Acetobacter nitrogenifigens DSM 23921 = NBRC 105050]|uniref:Glutathione hydrolase proenzyme n=1 Tax=Acetobacter nitrogenifigens DSM 23921 = NBRC 105050 TaxID=1120919 RepID=A0A511XC70_9PROT|nr:gamma-glutamyltransferase [Acetobacter nitrogenifigens]GBQ94141.1 gamma-glutamyltransferase [Acetobacter nitrogenifigens DSM 23921 = NBRC 105050]GEN60559.1 gamma-glutamyltranspeptidase [Acetobacter nitrogenifigens DSM 23921 = NBRC 105050]
MIVHPPLFTCDKTPVVGKKGVVVANHPMGAAAGAEMLAAGGNAFDAAAATLLALTVVEPMMVGVMGGGLSHLRLASGEHIVIDALSFAAASMTPEIYEPLEDEGPRYMDAVGRRNLVGPTAVAVPGNLLGWHAMQTRFGKLPFADVVAPAIRLAKSGFQVTHYLSGAINENGGDLLVDPVMRSLFLPDGRALPVGSRLRQPVYGEALELIAAEGASALHGGALGEALVRRIASGDDPGWLTEADLRDYRTVDRAPIVGRYRGFDIVGPPPPASSGVHVAQMLNMLEEFDVAAMGFGSVESLRVLTEIIKIAFEDRRRFSGDPAFVDVPVARLTAKDYARDCVARLHDAGGALADIPAYGRESADTTHVTVADGEGNVVAATHTINGLFGARFMDPETGIIPNNYMSNFDPHPGHALSIQPGKRVPTSMAPMMVLRDGAPRFALGMPGGLRIFPSVFQAIVNLLDHGMSLQEAVEAPRLWTQGAEVEIEPAYRLREDALAQSGYDVRQKPHIGGGMNAIGFRADGAMEGAACWRADGVAIALGGGLAKPGVRFWPDRAPENASDGSVASDAASALVGKSE